jgi:hypothetical protein
MAVFIAMRNSVNFIQGISELFVFSMCQKRVFGREKGQYLQREATQLFIFSSLHVAPTLSVGTGSRNFAIIGNKIIVHQ